MQKHINVVIPPLDKSYLYVVPEKLQADVQVGARIRVPLGRRVATGYVVESPEQEHAQQELGFEVKSIEDEAAQLCFSKDQLPFFEWVARYYGATLSQVIDVAIPPAAPDLVKRTVRVLADKDQSCAKGRVQKELLKMLEQAGGALDYSDILRRRKGAGPSLKRLQALELIAIDSQQVIASHLSDSTAPDWAKRSVELSETQLEATNSIISAIKKDEYSSFLLHGVTGSGKTEVYLEAIQFALERDLGVLVIVPEIALTPQLVDRFRARLGSNISVLHSGMNKRARWDAWIELLAGRCKIAIGARSAVFAPIKNLGLIIVDEEHDSSFKQNEGLRYNGRDLALMRAKMLKATVVLGSATPSLESYHRAQNDGAIYLSLPKRHATHEELDIEIVDINAYRPWEMSSKNITPRLHSALREVLERNEQAFILYNRRGFSSYLQCDKCESVYECPHCSVTLTYHQTSNSLICHYCNLRIVPPEFCPCSNKRPEGDPGKYIHRGGGTERVLDELKELFPGESIVRLDRDVAQKIEIYEDILDKMRSQEIKILVGTQMIAKGHDLPGVTLVGVVDCDVGLHMPDFRAAERAFQLLTQMSGRAGRADKKGRAILQTRVPRHPSLLATQHQDYLKYVNYELRQRAEVGYPPFSRILRIVAMSQQEVVARNALEKLAAGLRDFVEKKELKLKVMGPAPAPLQKLKTQWRWHLMLKGKSAAELNLALRASKNSIPKIKGLKVVFDMDPQDML